MPRPLRVRLDGAEWRVTWSGRMQDYGICARGANRESRIIRLRSRQTDDELLDTLLHEALHALHWEVEEAVIAERATELAALILRVFEVRRKVR